MTRRILAAIATAITLSGCNSLQEGRPSVAYFETDAEYKLKSAAHWQIVADDVANQVALSIAPATTPIRVSTAGRTRFERTFSAQLKSSLSRRGIPLSASASAGPVLEIDVERVTHATTTPYPEGSASLLAAGILVARDVAHSTTRMINSTAGVLVAADIAAIAQRRHAPLDTEIVITARLQAGDRYTVHRTDVYYIDDSDIDLFESTGKTYRLVGSETP